MVASSYLLCRWLWGFNENMPRKWSWVALSFSGLKQSFLVLWLETEAKSRRGENLILAIRPVVSDKALTLQLCRRESLQRWKAVKQVKCLLGQERIQYMWIDTWVDSEIVTPSWSLNHFYGAFHLVFLGPGIFICLILSPYLSHLRIFPYVWVHLSAKMDSSEKANG